MAFATKPDRTTENLEWREIHVLCASLGDCSVAIDIHWGKIWCYILEILESTKYCVWRDKLKHTAHDTALGIRWHSQYRYMYTWTWFMIFIHAAPDCGAFHTRANRSHKGWERWHSFQFKQREFHNYKPKFSMTQSELVPMALRESLYGFIYSFWFGLKFWLLSKYAQAQ